MCGCVWVACWLQSKLQSAYDAWARNEAGYSQRFVREAGLPWDKTLLEEVKVRSSRAAKD